MSMTTTRVTVPVEPTEEMIEAAESAGMTMAGSDMSSPDMTRYVWSAMLSAARAPEGVAVEALREALVQADLKIRSIPGTDQSDVEFIRAALATREEAPAGAGENWPTLADLHTIKGWLYGLSTAADLTDVVADGGVSVGDCYQQEAREFAGRIERIILALRAQPPAREDAQPVGLDVLKGWEDPKTPSVPGPVAWRCRNIGGVWSYGEAKQPNVAFCEPLYDHPAPDALRVVAEALEPFAAEAQRIRAPQSAETIMDNVELWQCGSVNITRTRLTYGDLRKATEALAALQAEQGAK